MPFSAENVLKYFSTPPIGSSVCDRSQRFLPDASSLREIFQLTGSRVTAKPVFFSSRTPFIFFMYPHVNFTLLCVPASHKEGSLVSLMVSLSISQTMGTLSGIHAFNNGVSRKSSTLK